MKTLMMIVGMLILAGCGGGSSAPAQSNATTIAAPSPTPTSTGIIISGKITGATQGTPVVMICEKASSAPPSQIGCSIPNEGYILDASTAIDANGNYSFTQVRTTLHPNIWIPIPAEYIYTVTPSLWLYPIFNYAPPPYTFCPARHTFGSNMSITGVNFDEVPNNPNPPLCAVLS